MTAAVTTTSQEDLDRWFDWASAGDVIRYSRFPKPYYGLWPAVLDKPELNRIEAMLNYSDLAFICGEKRGYVIMTEEMFEALTADEKPTLEDDDEQG